MTDCKTAIVRDSCIRCALKHIGQARALLLETKKGYPEFVVFALGHLAEAEDELVKDHQEQANKVREERLLREAEGEYEIDFTRLVRGLVAYDEKYAEDALKELANA